MNATTNSKPASNDPIPATMTAMAIDAYGGPEQLKPHTLPVPKIDPGEVLIRVAAAGVGVWDGLLREGAMAEMEPGGGHRFPIVPGADGAGTVVAVGAQVSDLAVGDVVYGYSFVSPKGGFHAEYVAVAADGVARVPRGLDIEQAGALAVTAITALCGLDGELHVQPGDRVVVMGASGGVGHAAVQLAKAMGATVMGIVSSADGAELARAAGADPVIDPKVDDVAAALREFAGDRLDAVLATVNGDGLAQAIASLKPGGRLAWPNGVTPVPEGGDDVVAAAFNGRPSRALLDKLNALIESRPFSVHLWKTLPLAEAADAHRALAGHHLGRIVLTMS